VNAADAAIRWFVDAQTGHILKETYRALSQDVPAQGETDFDNWKPIAGLTLPLLRTTSGRVRIRAWRITGR
jgi:hypothetical protein